MNSRSHPIHHHICNRGSCRHPSPRTSPRIQAYPDRLQPPRRASTCIVLDRCSCSGTSVFGRLHRWSLLDRSTNQCFDRIPPYWNIRWGERVLCCYQSGSQPMHSRSGIVLTQVRGEGLSLQGRLKKEAMPNIWRNSGTTLYITLQETRFQVVAISNVLIMTIVTKKQGTTRLHLSRGVE